MSTHSTLLFVLAAVAVVIAVRWVASRTSLPAAALLPLIGIAYALLPGPNVGLDPDLVLMVVLPPLLYSAALDSSLLDIRRNLRIVVSLSVVLVLLTGLLVGVGFHLFVAGATLAAGIAVGAAIAPPDPVAALAVGRRVNLPPKMVTIIQGEGLLNDATALTMLSGWPPPWAAPSRSRRGRAVRAGGGRRHRCGRGRRPGETAGPPAHRGPAAVQRDLARDAVRGVPAR
ncbi:cation:proton antiporter [Micromonospora sp. BRA006-A]|nr:cation:proton antiporter [Micromonospora sp. BRA006-A]